MFSEAYSIPLPVFLLLKPGPAEAPGKLIYENIKLGLINYTLLGLIEHHGVFIDSGHYVSYIRQSNKWYHCDDKHITDTNLLTLSNNVYLMFYAKEVDLGT